ncbi:tetratricopeptide repeat protein [Rhodopirellula sallentina]|uniref:tetratricopeptide repeat protein n=1 Tax=Rhodopirellula sallentina TaxID=1263869 RepID=UPI001181B186|nr:hypothetical protein [Rhodopirellula sallentina]
MILFALQVSVFAADPPPAAPKTPAVDNVDANQPVVEDPKEAGLDVDRNPMPRQGVGKEVLPEDTVELGGPTAKANENEAPDAPPKDRNLFGELVGQEPMRRGGEKATPLVKRLDGLLQRTTQVTNEYVETVERSSVLKKELSKKKLEFSQIPARYERATLTLVNAQLTLERLKGANVRSLPANDPNVIRYQSTQLEANQLAAEVKLLTQLRKSLTVEIRNIAAELQRLRRESNTFESDFLELIAGWESISSPLMWMSTDDAQQMFDECAAHLARYPDAHLVRLMLGYAQLHLNEQTAAEQNFLTALKKLGDSSSAFVDQVRLKALMGRLWVCLAKNDDVNAGKLIAAIGRIDKRHYDLALAKAVLLEQRELHAQAFEQYRRAVAIDKTHPSGYRMAADLVCRTDVRPPETALTLAKFAMKYDERGDWRNQLTMALCYHKIGQQEEYERLVKELRATAPDQAQEEVTQRLPK